MQAIDALDGSAPFEYAYDQNHNRQSRTRSATDETRNESYAYRSGTNRLDRVITQTSGTLDPRVGERVLRYNDAGRLFRVIDDGSLRAEYVYNARGQRTRKTVHETDGTSTTVLYHYDLQGRLIAETDETGTPIRDYVWSDGLRPVAQIDATTGGDRVLYLHTDHLLTPRLATNGIGQVVWRWEGEAFGNTDVGDGFSVEVNLRFPGQYFDEETGLHQNWHRYYEPTSGRYVRSDPIGFLGGTTNLYGYAVNDPVNFLDITGRAPNPVIRPGSTGRPVSGPFESPPTLADKVGNFIGKQFLKKLIDALVDGGSRFITRSPGTFAVLGPMVPGNLEGSACGLPGSPPCGPVPERFRPKMCRGVQDPTQIGGEPRLPIPVVQ